MKKAPVLAEQQGLFSFSIQARNLAQVQAISGFSWAALCAPNVRGKRCAERTLRTSLAPGTWIHTAFGFS